MDCDHVVVVEATVGTERQVEVNLKGSPVV